ncbi:hypothetical protein D3C72_1766120 [compost metagenome]
MHAQHQPGGVVTVEGLGQLTVDEATQRGGVAAELGAALLQGREDARAGIEHHLAGLALGGSGRGGLGEAERRDAGEQGRGQQDRDQFGFHLWASSVAGACAPGASWGAAPPALAGPLNMYLPTSCSRSTAGWVKTISSPDLSTSGSPPGCSPI